MTVPHALSTCPACINLRRACVWLGPAVHACPQRARDRSAVHCTAYCMLGPPKPTVLQGQSRQAAACVMRCGSGGEGRSSAAAAGRSGGSAARARTPAASRRRRARAGRGAAARAASGRGCCSRCRWSCPRLAPRPRRTGCSGATGRAGGAATASCGCVRRARGHPAQACAGPGSPSFCAGASPHAPPVSPFAPCRSQRQCRGPVSVCAGLDELARPCRFAAARAPGLELPRPVESASQMS